MTKPDSEILKVTVGAVKAAAVQCLDAKNVLKAMFPEVFEDEIKLEASKLSPGTIQTIHGSWVCCIRSDGPFAMRAIALADTFNWRFDHDGTYHVAIPSKK